MFDMPYDGGAMKRLDNATVVEFLSSAARVLSEHGLATSKDVDDLRLALSAINADAGARERPALLELDRQGAACLDVLRLRFGTRGLALNLARHTLKRGVTETRRTLTGWGQQLLKKAELNFNRGLLLRRGGKPERETLYASLILDFSQILAEAAEALAAVAVELSRMNAHGLDAETENDRSVDRAMAEALGFDGITEPSLPGFAERCAKRRLSTALALVGDAAQRVNRELNAGERSASYAPALAGESLSAEIRRLEALELPESEALPTLATLTDWEVRRIALVGALDGVNAALRHLAAESLASLSTGVSVTSTATQTSGPQPKVVYPEATRRRIAIDLVATGIGPKTAEDAAASLFRYLDEHRARPSELLSSELAKIHPALTDTSLTTLTALAKDRSTMGAQHAQKLEAAKRAKHLAERFIGLGATLVLAVAVVVPSLLALGGCGLKTRPKSEVVEFRPDIPFRDPKAP